MLSTSPPPCLPAHLSMMGTRRAPKGLHLRAPTGKKGVHHARPKLTTMNKSTTASARAGGRCCKQSRDTHSTARGPHSLLTIGGTLLTLSETDLARGRSDMAMSAALLPIPTMSTCFPAKLCMLLTELEWCTSPSKPATSSFVFGGKQGTACSPDAIMRCSAMKTFLSDRGSCACSGSFCPPLACPVPPSERTSTSTSHLQLCGTLLAETTLVLNEILREKRAE
mmetsp:Transcript_28174/g.91315  ORF Transcript_28174/g.91315 Transcript_28174/m.91315 type:complete len:224 (+) Transcript_28174:606-1277(+)